MTNLLVCRIARGIDLNRSSKLFLEMVRPMLKLLAKEASRGTNVDLDTALADLESQCIVYLQHNYLQGEIAYPLHYLFGIPKGVLRRYASNYGRKERRYETTHQLATAGPGSEDEDAEQVEPSWDPREEVEPLELQRTRVAREVLDDGITLTLAEYQVLSFCLANALDAKRPLNGLHVYLGRTMGVGRARVTKIYSDALRKVRMEVEARVRRGA